MKITILTLLGLFAIPFQAVATPMPDYTFKSPAFNGLGYSSHVLTIENQETSPTTLNGKKELAETVKKQDELARQASSRMNMFALSKSILLFGIGLSFMAFFSRSRWVLYGSAATALIGIAITVNGFFTLV